MIKGSSRPTTSNEKKAAVNLTIPETKEAAYVLGFLWADGHIGNKYTVSMELKRTDLEDIKDTFEKVFGDWKFYFREREGRAPQGTLRSSNKVLYEFLEYFDYKTKTIGCPRKIINRIPIKHQYMWWRGFLMAMEVFM